MNLLSCLSPVKIKNPYTNEVIYVPCRKCYACVTNHQRLWVDRMYQESRVHRYSLFFTLTYNDDNVPFYFVNGDKLVNFKTGETFDYTGYDSSVSYIKFRKNLPVLDVKDVQLFIKRLRKRIYLKFGNNEVKIKYAICGEYGPKTFRPHYHGILWYDDARLNKLIRTYLFESWKNGFISCSSPRGFAENYVAKYIAGNSDYPTIYLSKAFKPFFLVSRKPPIGIMSVCEAEIQKFVRTGAVKFSLFDGKRFVDVPLWKTLENTYFPKIKGFDKLTHSDRVFIYGLSKGIENFESDIKLASRICKKRCCLNIEFSTFKYLFDYGYLFTDKKGFYSTLVRTYYVSRKVLHFCEKFEVSLDKYVTFIENYYSNKSYELLKTQMEFEEDFAQVNYPAQLLFLDKVFLDYVLTSRKNSLPDWVMLTLQGFDNVQQFYNITGEFDDNIRRDYFDIYKIEHFKTLLRSYTKSHFENAKTKKKNDYLDYLKFHNLNSHSL